MLDELQRARRGLDALPAAQQRRLTQARVRRGRRRQRSRRGRRHRRKRRRRRVGRVREPVVHPVRPRLHRNLIALAPQQLDRGVQQRRRLVHADVLLEKRRGYRHDAGKGIRVEPSRRQQPKRLINHTQRRRHVNIAHARLRQWKRSPQLAALARDAAVRTSPRDGELRETPRRSPNRVNRLEPRRRSRAALAPVAKHPKLTRGLRRVRDLLVRAFAKRAGPRVRGEVVESFYREFVHRVDVSRGEVKVAHRGRECAPVHGRQQPRLVQDGVDAAAHRADHVVATDADVLDEGRDRLHARARARRGLVRASCVRGVGSRRYRRA